MQLFSPSLGHIESSYLEIANFFFAEVLTVEIAGREAIVNLFMTCSWNDTNPALAFRTSSFRHLIPPRRPGRFQVNQNR